jgi:uncharacterized membrane protein YdbT with pleckstrin-like domain
MSFSDKQLLPGETIVVSTNQHALVLIKPILLNIFLDAGIVALYLFAFPELPEVLALTLIPAMILLWQALVRSRNQYIITNRRVVKQEGVFNVKSYDASLDKINNIFHEQNLWGKMLGYGDVGLETASEQGTSVFRFIPNPLGFKNAIIEQREAYKHAPSGSKQTDIPQMLDQLARLRNEKVITEAEFEQKKKRLLDQI